MLAALVETPISSCQRLPQVYIYSFAHFKWDCSLIYASPRKRADFEKTSVYSCTKNYLPNKSGRKSCSTRDWVKVHEINYQKIKKTWFSKKHNNTKRIYLLSLKLSDLPLEYQTKVVQCVLLSWSFNKLTSFTSSCTSKNIRDVEMCGAKWNTILAFYWQCVNSKICTFLAEFIS